MTAESPDPVILDDTVPAALPIVLALSGFVLLIVVFGRRATP